MAPATRSRRPLPKRVYWVRRLLVLGVVPVLVLAVAFGVVGLLDHRSGGSGSEQATSVASSPSASGERRDDRRDHRRRAGERADKDSVDGKKKKKELAQPQGPCSDGDVLVTPDVPEAHLGEPVRIVLEVTTVDADACYWEVSPESVFVKIEGDYGTVWSSQHCPTAVPTERIVPRKERAAKVSMWWNGKESDDGCPSWTEWVLEGGSYTVVAAARGSVDPVDTGFFLGPAVAATVTRTPTPTATPTPSPTRTESAQRERGRDGERAGKND